MSDLSLGTPSSNPPVSTGSAAEQRDGEGVPSDWRYWFERAYRAWAGRQEQLVLFDDWWLDA